MDVKVPDQQQHLLAHWKTLSADQQSALAAQLSGVDFGLMQKLFAGEDKTVDWEDVASRASAPAAFRLEGENRFSTAEAVAAGTKALAAAEVGVILVAGGQGSRLGFDQPKGNVPDWSSLRSDAFPDPHRKTAGLGAEARDLDSAVSDDQSGHARADD